MKLIMKKAPTIAASAHASGLIFQTSLGSKYDHIVTLNSNLSSLKLWVGEVTFTFSNSTYAMKDISTATGGVVTSSNVKGFAGIGVGGGYRFAVNSQKTDVVAYDTSAVTGDRTVLGVFFYS